MKLNHLDLHVSNVQETVLFFERFFDLRLTTSRTSPAIAILDDEAGFVLVLQRNPAPSYPEGFHLGFLVDDAETVRRTQAAAKSAGVEVSDVVVNNRGTMVYFAMPDGYSIEVSHRSKSAAHPE